MSQQKQVKRETGALLRFNLDPETCHLMRSAQKLHEDNSNAVSLSVIVRRALRVYHGYLSKLPTRDAIEVEALETKRAAKGVL